MENQSFVSWNIELLLTQGQEKNEWPKTKDSVLAQNVHNNDHSLTLIRSLVKQIIGSKENWKKHGWLEELNRLYKDNGKKLPEACRILRFWYFTLIFQSFLKSF